MTRYIVQWIRILHNLLLRLRQGNKYKFGRRRSLVRLLGSALPWPQPTRICLGITTRQSIVCHDAILDVSTLEELENKSDIAILVDKSLNKNLCLNKPDVVAHISDGYSKSHVNSKILALEQEVHELRSLMEQILSQHHSDDLYTEIGHGIGIATSSVEVPAPPPLPPPPPPPLPPMLYLNSQSWHSVNKSTRNVKTYLEEPKEMLTISLDHINNIKLRPVERTLTGSPVRRPPDSTDPSSILAAILKKRYAAIHIQTPERNKYGFDSEFDMNE